MANFRPIVLVDGRRKVIGPGDQIDPAVLPPSAGGGPSVLQVDTLADLPDPLDEDIIYFVGQPKSIAQVVDGVNCYSRQAETSTAGILTGQGRTVLADENGRVIWRF